MRRGWVAGLIAVLVVATTLLCPRAAEADEYSSVVTADNPSLYWRLNETTGPTFADSSGNNRGGTFNRNGSNPLPTYGVAGIGPDQDLAIRLSFSGEIAEQQAHVFSSNTFTTAVWIKTTSNRGGWISGMSAIAASGHDRIMMMDRNGQVDFGVFNGQLRILTSPTALNDGQWHYLVGTLGTGGLRFYVDGVLVASQPNTTSAQSHGGSGAAWLLGCRNSGADTSGWTKQVGADQCFTGDLDEFAVWETTALSPTQIANQYATVKNRMSVGTVVDPSLTFTVAGSGAACNGVTPTSGTSSTGSSISLGRVGTSGAVAAQTMSVSSNSTNGWKTSLRSTGPLTSPNGQSFAPVSGLRASPAAFPNAGNEGFGFTLGGAPSMGGPLWGQIRTTNDLLHTATGPTNSFNYCIAYKAQTASNTPAGSYSTTLIYTATPRY